MVRFKLDDRSAGNSPVERIVSSIERAFLKFSMLTIVTLLALICISVIGRTFFNLPIPDDVVLAENLMPIIVALPFAYATARRGHIEVEVFTSWLPKEFFRPLSAFAHFLALLIFSAILWCVWIGVLKDLNSGQYYEGELALPVWPAKLVFVIALALFCIRLLLNLAEDLGLKAAPSTPSHAEPLS
ncbi:TRAP transporter small permease [Sneathiella sp. HT1-7]|uniref:TRAP transporter small permease n=1 Tax=Sneathiella sp. HT1-7 TaxID=2887192 RepID=UPI001D1427F6|nr:TRAP transporter small permease [Sneathiella sp. HT1-7]MCC3306344.1 TRAP transporter small permease [Sneathiella sp. HT1-7]